MNYQYLHYEFFTTCRKRKINKVPMLLLIYLRGLYSRFGNIFTWKDKIIISDLGINRKMLQRSRLALQEKGVIDFVSGKGQGPTQYLILDSVLAPERVDKKQTGLDRGMDILSSPYIRVMKIIKIECLSKDFKACLSKTELF